MDGEEIRLRRQALGYSERGGSAAEETRAPTGVLMDFGPFAEGPPCPNCGRETFQFSPDGDCLRYCYKERQEAAQEKFIRAKERRDFKSAIRQEIRMPLRHPGRHKSG